MNIAITITRSSWIYTLHLAPAPGGTIYTHLRDRYAKRVGPILALPADVPGLDGSSLDSAVAHAEPLYIALCARITSTHAYGPASPV